MSDTEITNEESSESPEIDSLLGSGGETTPEPQEVDSSWRDGLSEEYVPTWERFKDINGAAKSYAEMRKQLDSRLKLPGDDSTDDDWSDFYNKSGRPDNVEGYEYKSSEDMPEDVPWDEDKAQGMLQMAHDLGLSKRQTNKFMKRMEASAVDVYNQIKASNNDSKKAEMEASITALKEELGGGYQEFLGNSNWALENFADAKTKQAIKDNLGNNLGVIKMFGEIGKQLRPKEGVETSGSEMVVDSSGLSEASQIRSDPNHRYYEAYRNEKHPQYKEARDYVFQLYNRAYRNAKR